MMLDCNIVGTASEYFDRLGREMDLDNGVEQTEFNLIGEIIALQISFYCLRRLTHSCQSNSDYVRGMLKDKIFDYGDTFNTKFEDFNEEFLW